MKTPSSAVVAVLIASPIFCANAEPHTKQKSDILIGEKIAFDRKKGNCLACHAIKGGKLPGNIGPPLVNMKQRYPNKSRLKEQIESATANNPNSMMPPYKKHKILSESELDRVVEYIYSL